MEFSRVFHVFALWHSLQSLPNAKRIEAIDQVKNGKIRGTGEKVS
jgi:hypothetical protein